MYNHSRTELSDNSLNLISITNGYDGSNLGEFYVDVVNHILNYTEDAGGGEVKPEPDNDEYYVVLDDELVLVRPLSFRMKNVWIFLTA